MPRIKKDIVALSKTHTESAVKTLAGIMNQPTASSAARVAAANSLLDRAWGKPEVHIEIDETIRWLITDDQMDVDEWQARYQDSLAAPARPPKSIN